MIPYIIAYRQVFFKGKTSFFSRFFDACLTAEFLATKFKKSVDIPRLSVYNKTNYLYTRSP